MKKWLFDVLYEKKTSHSSLKDEFIPLLVKAQCRPGLLKPFLEKGKTRMNYVEDFFESSRIPFASQSQDVQLKCHAYVLSSGFCLRVNNFPAYHKANFNVCY